MGGEGAQIFSEKIDMQLAAASLIGLCVFTLVRTKRSANASVNPQPDHCVAAAGV
jgi:hypothetical protein